MAVIDLAVSQVSKRYRVTEPATGTATGMGAMLRRLRKRTSDFWALREISFDVARGETLGIIGDNGAGKSTILKLLSGVTAPTSGEIIVRGRMSALIEVGSGFHPELTGRENVFLSGSILGMRRREISDKLERIIDFAGVRDFIDTPVKRYSSGMYLRLGFSIAAHLEPDVLLLDEVLAVGDAEFQAKCLERVTELHRHGRTIVFISHDLFAVERLCRRVLLLSKGRILADGPAREVIALYQELGRTRTVSEEVPARDNVVSGEADITSVIVVDRHGERTSVLRTGEPATFRITYRARAEVRDARFELYAYTMIDGRFGPWCQLTTAAANNEGCTVRPGDGAVEFTVDELGLLPGVCHLSARIAHRDDPPGRSIAWRPEGLTLRIDPGRQVRGTFYLPHRWRRAEPDPVGTRDDNAGESRHSLHTGVGP
jgi:ABC-type polysaccharide/polyol phosphate transport system ATPase subunit